MIKAPSIQASDSQSDYEKEIQSEPKIFFGVDISGSEQNLFPTYDNHLNKYNLLRKSEDLKISPIFRSSLNQCKNRVWILDSYLHTDDYRKKLTTLLDDIACNQFALDAKFYLLRNADKEKIQKIFDDTNSHIRSLSSSKNFYTQIEPIFINDMNWLHDRFAILDNTLWHFGSDVGSSNKSLHATSYGWSAEQASIFFKKLWEKNRE